MNIILRFELRLGCRAYVNTLHRNPKNFPSLIEVACRTTEPGGTF